MADTYTIQFRRGMYADFDTSKIRPGEPVAILGNDPSVPSGKALYIAFAANDVRRLCSIEDISEMVNAGEFVGPQGPKGEKGDKGDPGEKGADGTVAFESLTPEQKESLRGISIESASVDTDGNLTITFSDGDSEDIGNIMGPQGIQGPKGDKGDVGPQGPKGNKGDVGPQGPKGNKGDAGPKGDNMSDEQAAQIEQNKKDVDSLKKEITDLKSVMKDIHNNTPHVSTIETFYDIRRTGKVYQTKIWKFSTNPTSTGEKLLDNAGLEFEPSTDTTEGKDDYLNGEHPLFEWVHCNYKRYDDGTAYPVATEYDDDYATTGAVDVGAMQMSFYWNWDASNPEYDLVTISDMPNTKYGLKPWTESKRADGTVLPWCIGSAYVSGIASDGLLRSQPGLKPEKWQCHNNMITNYQKKGKGHWGAGAERNTFQIIFNIIKGATKNSQSLFQGCTSYSFQYSASVQSTDVHTYFPVTNAQAQNIIVGSYVSVGYGELKTDTNTVNIDRGVKNMHKYADDVKVLRIETLDENNKAVYLDIETGFNTTPIKLSDTVNAPITLSSMHWWSGTTDKVIGRHDGSYVSNTDGKHPYRVQGREYTVGGYMVASDTVMDFQSDYSKKVYIAPKGLAHSSSDATIRSKYTCIGTIPANPDGKEFDYWIGDISVDVNTGGWFPSAKGSSDSQGWADMLYAGGTSTSGTREYLVGGSLRHGSNAGCSCVGCWNGLDWTSWGYCAAD